MPPAKGLHRSVARRRSLHGAWRVVRENGLRASSSEETKKAVLRFEEAATSNIDSILHRLSRRAYEFSPGKGVPIQKQGKSSRRPIVISTVSDRVVKRAVLDVLQAREEVQEYVDVKTSFGCIKLADQRISTRDAVLAAHSALARGVGYYVRSDIKEFFRFIPRAHVLDKLRHLLPDDDDFFRLLERAVTTELSNLEQLGAHRELFPIHEIGVAQGCCLSPFLGNVLLHDFDVSMNKGGVVCLRYVDDFLILAPDHGTGRRVFGKAQRLLRERGLSAYPLEEKEKTACGRTHGKVEFLGCVIANGRIAPSKKSRDRVVQKVENILRDSLTEMRRDPSGLAGRRGSLVEALHHVSNILQGWGNQYSFCTDRAAMEAVDPLVDDLLRRYLGGYSRIKKSLGADAEKDRRRLLGVHLVADSIRTPSIE